MSGDTPCTIKAIWECPFCGKKARRIIVDYGESDGYTHYDDHDVQELVLRIECEDTLKKLSALYTCPAMSESGAYFLHIYLDGSCHAYYY